MAMQCPGRDANANLESVLLPCPGCGRQVEIFGDEQRVHCRCGEWVFRDVLPTCAQWCPSAEQCFGAIGGFAKATMDLERTLDQKAQEERFRTLQELVRQALEACPGSQVEQVPER